MEEKKIRRGEVYFVDLRERHGSIQRGRRPCIVIQNNTGNKNAPTTIMVPTTSREKTPLPTHVDLSSVHQLVTGTKALTEQPFTIDQSEVKDYICTLDKHLIARVNIGLLISLGLRNFIEWKKLKSSLRNKKSQSGNKNEEEISFEKMKGGI